MPIVRAVVRAAACRRQRQAAAGNRSIVNKILHSNRRWISGPSCMPQACPEHGQMLPDAQMDQNYFILVPQKLVTLWSRVAKRQRSMRARRQRLPAQASSRARGSVFKPARTTHQPLCVGRRPAHLDLRVEVLGLAQALACVSLLQRCVLLVHALDVLVGHIARGGGQTILQGRGGCQEPRWRR